MSAPHSARARTPADLPSPTFGGLIGILGKKPCLSIGLWRPSYLGMRASVPLELTCLVYVVSDPRLFSMRETKCQIRSKKYEKRRKETREMSEPCHLPAQSPCLPCLVVHSFPWDWAILSTSSSTRIAYHRPPPWTSTSTSHIKPSSLPASLVACTVSSSSALPSSF